MHEETVFTLAISTVGEPFDRGRNGETARILREVARRLEGGELFGPDYETLHDRNGQAAGRAAFRVWKVQEAAGWIGQEARP